MKKSISISKFLSVALLAIVAVFSAMSLFAHDPIGSVEQVSESLNLISTDTPSTANISLAALAALLGDYVNVPKNAAGIWKRMYTGLELFNFTRKISGQTGKYAGMSSSATEMMQAFQKGFTPKGVVSFQPYINEVFRLKIDFILDNIDEITDGYVQFLYDETKLRKDWPLVKYIIAEHFTPQLIEEMNTAMCRGVYVAPTPGTAGTSIGSMNGLQTIISNEITATNLVPIVTGVTTAANAVDNFETFADGIDDNILEKGGVIFTSKAMARFYKTDYRATFGATNDQAAKNNLELDNHPVRIIGLKGWGSSQRMMFTPTGAKGNLLQIFDKIVSPKKFDVQQDKREIAILADWHSAVGFNTLDEVFVNDQA